METQKIIQNKKEEEQIKMNYINEIKKVASDIGRYNGGWLKRVTGLDKTQKNGYSLEGDFVEAGNYQSLYKQGVYVDCDKDGSRKNQEWNYTLFKLDTKGITVIKRIMDGGRTWAVDLWDEIEANIQQKEEGEKTIKYLELIEKFANAENMKEIEEIKQTQLFNKIYKEI